MEKKLKKVARLEKLPREKEKKKGERERIETLYSTAKKNKRKNKKYLNVKGSIFLKHLYVLPILTLDFLLVNVCHVGRFRNSIFYYHQLRLFVIN